MLSSINLRLILDNPALYEVMAYSRKVVVVKSFHNFRSVKLTRVTEMINLRVILVSALLLHCHVYHYKSVCPNALDVACRISQKFEHYQFFYALLLNLDVIVRVHNFGLEWRLPRLHFAYRACTKYFVFIKEYRVLSYRYGSLPEDEQIGAMLQRLDIPRGQFTHFVISVKKFPSISVTFIALPLVSTMIAQC